MRRDGVRQAWIVAVVLGLWLSGGAAAGAGTFPVFGPETFTLSTTSASFVRGFTVDDPAATAWTLRIDGGAGSGFGPGTTAVVKLNGALILRSSGFGTDVLTRPVSLAASNILSIEIRGTPGTSLGVTVEGLDGQPPALAITSPASGSGFFDPRIVLRGTATDPLSGLAAVTCNGAAATVSGVSGGPFSCGLNLSPGANAVRVQARDVAGNTSSADLTLTLAEPPPVEPPEVHITAPGPGLVTKDPLVTVTGTINRGILSVTVNGVEAILQGNTFTALDVPLGEGINRLLATAQTGTGESASDSMAVRRDTHPPQVVIESPRNGERLVSGTVTVAGTVNDLIPGATVNADDVQVTLNGVPAAVDNRTFLLPDVPLSLGENVLVAEATDRAGNRRTSSIRVTREPDLAGIRVVIAGGNNQRGAIKTTLPEPLAVRLLGPDGQPLPNRPVELAVVKGDGLLGVSAGQRRVTILTDGDGTVSVPFTMGSRTGEGFHRVRATTPGSLTFAEFCATAEPEAPSRIAVARRPPLRGVAGQPVSEPLSVIVTDASGNPVADVPVTFTVEFGGGSFGSQPAATVSTNRDGIAEAVFTLGASAGRANNKVSANFTGNPGMPAVFLLSGYEVGPPAETRISGIVQNSAGQPIVGAEVEVEETEQKTLTGPDGRFSIAVPPGGHHVSIDGATANDPAAGIFYPYIEFAVEAISGADNPLDQVVILPFLDMENAKVVGGDEDVILGIKDVPGFALKVFAHSTIRHDGTRGPVLLSSSQVSFDKVPMPPPQGAVPLFFGTLQPGGIHFDPPAQVIYPNTNGLAPGDVADLFSFDHHVGQFVNVGPGTVSEDGTVIVSDPGFGIVATGWHGATRAPSPTGQAANGCGGQFEWQYVQADGTLSSVQSGPVSLFVSDDAQTARVRAPFNPGGGTFLSASWNGGNPIVTRSDENAGGNVSFVTVTAGSATGNAGLTSPVYEFRDPAGTVVTCRVPAQAHVAKVEIEINDPTPVDDDMVQLSNKFAPQPLKAAGHAKLMGSINGSELAVKLESPQDPQNPRGRFQFLQGGTATDTLTLRLQPNGPEQDFEIIGREGSRKKDDAVIEAYCDPTKQTACGVKKGTVFYFDPANVTVRAGAPYSLTTLPNGKLRYGPNGGVAVTIDASAKLMPPNLNCSSPPLKDLRVGVSQNGKVFKSITFTQPDLSHVQWLAGNRGDSYLVPDSVTLVTNVKDFYNDAPTDVPFVAPLYTFAGPPPQGCGSSSGSLRTNDSPDQEIERTIDFHGPSGQTLLVVPYQNVRFTFVYDFVDWVVAFDTAANTQSPLRQTTWRLYVDSSSSMGQLASPDLADTPPGMTPVEGPQSEFLNNITSNPLYQSPLRSSTGTVVYHP